jgi:NAD-dependent deacetylase
MNIVVFSGAGMSAESGIQTFRDSGGLWEHYSIEDVATPNAWKKNPALVQDFYNKRRKQIIETEPNQAHYLIREFEKFGQVYIITQNIDDLHERAGSTNVWHLHGNIRFAKSSGPDQEKALYPIEGSELNLTDLCPSGFPLRPHVVWFGEEVPAMHEAYSIIDKSDVLIVIGTSLKVYPAAGLIHAAPAHSRKIVVDPNADELSIPPGFLSVPMGASEGLKWLLENPTHWK